MYNEEIKRRYIEEKERQVILPNNYLVLQFQKTTDMENELGKDISNFTSYEVIEYYKLLNSSSFESLTVLNSQLSMYTQWCLQENLVKDNQNHFLEMNKDILNSCVNKAILNMKIISRETILKWVDEIPNPKDQFILLSLFEYGKSKNFIDIVNVTMDDLNDHILHLPSGRDVKISAKLRNIILDSYSENVYYSISGKGIKQMPLISYNNQIVKNYPNAKDTVSEFQKGRNIYMGLMRILDYVGVIDWCSANSIVESGKIYAIKHNAKKLDMKPMDYIYSDNIGVVENQFGSGIIKSIFSVKYAEYL